MKKGISVASLGIVLIILSVVLGIVVINSNIYFNEVKKTRFVTEYILVEAAINKYYDNSGSYPTKKENNIESLAVLKASNNADEVQFGENFGEALVGIPLKVIDVSLLGYDDLTTGSGNSETDYYGVSEQGDVYYIKGVRYNNKVYYKVTDELK